MTEQKAVNEKINELGAGISDRVHDLIREAKPMLNQATDCIVDQMSELTHNGMEAARKGKREMESAGQDLMTHTAQMIRHKPFKAMLIAAGLGAAMTAVVGLMSRSHTHHPH